MHAQAPAPNPVCPERRHTLRFPFYLVAGFLAVALITAVAWLTMVRSSEGNLVWISSSQLARATQPGPFTRIKYKLMNLTAPVWRHFARRRTSIQINTA